MRRLFLIISILTAALLLLQCSDSTDPVQDDRRMPEDLTTAELDMVESTGRFGFKLFSEVLDRAEPDENVFISPLSVSFALGMTYNGASGETREAIADALEMSGMSLDEINESYRSLIDFLVNYDPLVIMQIANSIWYRLGVQVDSTFIELNRTYFDAVTQELDFNSSEAADIINSWVFDNTNGKIEKIIDPPINATTVMFLINAIYFKADWLITFDENDTESTDFHLPDGSITDCEMMYNEEDYQLLRNDLFQAVRLPYGRESYCMTVLLPNQNVPMDSLVGEINEENWMVWQDSFVEAAATLYMPRFKFEYKTNLNDMLKAMGMEIAFIEGVADFSNMFTSRDVFIDNVIQKTFIQVDEKGTEAAAVTAVEIGAESAPDVININRPFVFVIHEKESGTILFMGKVVNPVWQE
ncbi:MAG: serpin family protein [Candidatus Electryonea clarkiae]|nr:serpin family protein [Candidatus Electryonea clarkiae]